MYMQRRVIQKDMRVSSTPCSLNYHGSCSTSGTCMCSTGFSGKYCDSYASKYYSKDVCYVYRTTTTCNDKSCFPMCICDYMS